MTDNAKEFFRELRKLCERYEVQIVPLDPHRIKLIVGELDKDVFLFPYFSQQTCSALWVKYSAESF